MEIAIRFPEIVLLMLTHFDKLNPYTKYKKDIVLKLKDYSFDIYHLAQKTSKQWGSLKCPRASEKHQELGLPDSYQDLSNLKKRVIAPC